MSNTNDQKFMAEKIRSEYMEKQSTELDALRVLDAEVKRPALVFAGVWGTVSALVMGSGMSLVMTNIGDRLGTSTAMTAGVVVSVIGLGMAGVTYPIYKKILNGRKKKYADEIMKLSNQILENQ